VIHFLGIVLLVVAMLVLLGLAAVGVLVLFLGPWDDERTRIQQETRRAERQIAEIGRRAQVAILDAALRQAGVRPQRPAADGRREQP